MCGHNRIKPERCFLKALAIIFDIPHQIDPKIIKCEFIDRHIFIKVFKIKHLFPEAKELFVTICQFIFHKVLYPIQEVVFSRSRNVHKGHPRFNPGFKLDVIVQIISRPKVYHLNLIINTADPVNPAKTLDNANRIPVDVIVDQIVTVLKVLAFGNTICCNEDINLLILC